MTNDGNNDGSRRAAEWRARWRELRRTVDRDIVPDVLGPPEAFSPKRATAADRARCNYVVPQDRLGPHSRTVALRMSLSCAGWTTEPTSEEFYRVVHDPQRTRRNAEILLIWYHEAEIPELLYARLEEAYAWRDLVRALHHAGLTRGEAARRINWFSER